LFWPKQKQTNARTSGIEKKNGAVAAAAYRRTGCVTDWPTATSNSIHFHVRLSLSFHNFPNGFIIIRLGQNKKKNKTKKKRKKAKKLSKWSSRPVMADGHQCAPLASFHQFRCATRFRSKK
jgi:hypothetical protein